MDCVSLVARQRAFFRSGSTRPLEFRRARLADLARAIEANESRLLDALRADLGKPAYEAYATEIGLVLGELRHALRHLTRWAAPQRRRVPWLAWPASGWISPEPRGVSLILGPWNYPVQLLLSPLVGALAAGNCVLLKPSEFAPHTASVLVDLVGATFAEDCVAIVAGGSDVAVELLRQPFDHIFFTGSTRIGRAVMTAAAAHLASVTLELGGKCPCIVCADAPIRLTARRIAWGKFMNAGQTCVAPDYVVADRRIRGDLVAAMGEVLREFYGDHPRHSPAYSRIVNRQHFERLTGYLRTGPIAHGGQHDVADLYVAPTILVDPPREAPVMQEEIFGPILPVLAFDALEEVLADLAAQPAPLALYLFSQDKATQRLVQAGTRSGGLCLNDTVTHMIGASLPFGGVGESGVGAYHGKASFDAFTHYRSVLQRSFAFDPGLRYPPPRLSLDTLKRFYRYLVDT